MNPEYVQNLRYKLQKRVRRLNSTGYEVFHFSLKQFWGFLNSHPAFVDIVEDLQRRCPGSDSDAERVVAGSETLVCGTELENAALACSVIKKCVESDSQMVEVSVGFAYGQQRRYDDSLEYFRDLFLDVLYEYIDEQLDDQRAILALLRRYKQKCEWFQRDRLFDMWQSDTRRGENLLAFHLYEYLHDQGLDFVIEPLSASGEVDLVAAQRTDDPLIADAKVFGPETPRRYLASGFNQIYQYTLDYNEPSGYLIIYNTSGRDLGFALAEQEQSTPLVIHNNKTIFLLVIDISPYETTASQRGPLTPVEVTQEDLVRSTGS